jgi:hypothetical protein
VVALAMAQIRWQRTGDHAAIVATRSARQHYFT